MRRSLKALVRNGESREGIEKILQFYLCTTAHLGNTMELLKFSTQLGKNQMVGHLWETRKIVN